jgi:hypothetical protein
VPAQTPPSGGRLAVTPTTGGCAAEPERRDALHERNTLAASTLAALTVPIIAAASTPANARRTQIIEKVYHRRDISQAGG